MKKYIILDYKVSSNFETELNEIELNYPLYEVFNILIDSIRLERSNIYVVLKLK
jgi:hypothetical protein